MAAEGRVELRIHSLHFALAHCEQRILVESLEGVVDCPAHGLGARELFALELLDLALRAA